MTTRIFVKPDKGIDFAPQQALLSTRSTAAITLTRIFIRAIILSSFFSCVSILQGNAQNSSTIETYFEKIRRNEPTLTAFFSAMPKGGDLHNHFSGSIYAESYWQYIVERNFFIDPISLTISKEPKKKYLSLKRLADRDKLTGKDQLGIFKQRVIQEWSIKDYDNVRPPDLHFFESFGKFPFDGKWDEVHLGLKELVDRASIENVQYLEVMLTRIKFNIPQPKAIVSNEAMRVQMLQSNNSLSETFARLLKYYEGSGSKDSIACYLKSLHNIHNKISSNPHVEVRYLAFVGREQEPLEVFKNLAIAFQAAEQDSLIVGVNIVQREDGPISMKDYKLHMAMFRYLKSKHDSVKCSLHAGELTLGLVKPEDLSFHINDAVFVAGADRIGHGVDMPYEKNAFRLLKHMSSKKIPVEINLSSNEFILKVSGEAHPIMLYKNQNVPIVISTDDAGILRTNLTRQYVLLAQRYPEFTYAEIKDIIINSIEYSFIEEADVKNLLKEDLIKKIAAFEEEIISNAAVK